jgi:hypothetical protein
MEKSISELKQQVKEYEKLSEYDKIMGDQYSDIIDEKESCAFVLNEYKTKFNNINTNVKCEPCNDDNFGDIMKKIGYIKQNMNDGKSMDDMLDMYGELCKYKEMLKVYFEGKKMEVINI